MVKDINKIAKVYTKIMISKLGLRKTKSTGNGTASSRSIASPMYNPTGSSPRKIYGGGPTGQSSYRQHNDHLQSPCNSFLLGGNFHAGKDKRRRAFHPRQRSLWHRIFFSTMP